MNFKYRSLTLLILLISGCFANAQTVVVYSENFNSGNGGWTIGGYQPSWNYGIPSLNNILSNGSACFVTADAGAASVDPFTGCIPAPAPTANGNFYNCCERSFVESPIIDLTGVISPFLKIDINVYCEQTFDGAKMQLSVNGGSTWQDIGNYSSSAYQSFPSVINCREKNWYNKSAVNYLSGTAGGCGSVNVSFGGSNNGWSGGCSQNGTGSCGNPDAHGTNGWVTASHCLQQAANKSNVKLRIVFGAGSQVYADGIAFDNVQILDVFPNVNFVSAPLPGCLPAMSFTNITDCGESWLWNFGHNGPGNTSVLEYPVHQFPAPGIYAVTLTATDFCGGLADTIIQENVPPGNAPVSGGITVSNASLCNSPDDSIHISLLTSGTPPYNINYTFNNAVVNIPGLTGNNFSISGLIPGTYTNLTLTDSAGCVVPLSATVTLPYNADTLLLITSGDTLIDPGNKANLKATTNISSSFSWFPITGLDDPLSATPVAAPLISTVYNVVATDINGCSVIGSVTVDVSDKVNCNRFYIPNTFTPNGDEKNDGFSVVIDPDLNLSSYSLKIFNRWGQTVFESANPFATWYGKGNEEGIYLVKADFKCRNKTHATFNGIINLIR